jgi:hypothetical protein
LCAGFAKRTDEPFARVRVRVRVRVKRIDEPGRMSPQLEGKRTQCPDRSP